MGVKIAFCYNRIMCGSLSSIVPKTQFIIIIIIILEIQTPHIWENTWYVSVDHFLSFMIFKYPSWASSLFKMPKKKFILNLLNWFSDSFNFFPCTVSLFLCYFFFLIFSQLYLPIFLCIFFCFYSVLSFRKLEQFYFQFYSILSFI